MRAAELHEGIVDEAWLERKPGWSAAVGWPISFVWVWSMSTPTERSS
jgi:hypothetical protein